MLKQRILTALVLLALLLPTLLLKTPWPFALVTLAAMAVAGWEWARLNGAGRLSIPFGIGIGLACAAALWAGWGEAAPHLAWWLATLVWVLGGTWVLRGGVAAWPRLARTAR
ncbi:MAG: phosphatidate cytidylyltransferase, partial [Pseudomonadota bacterium]|nr:phosphatidate cytidylyltransferase [Pseudomonadota bacterium]